MNRKDFPILNEYVFLDSGSGALKPKQVVDAIREFYEDYPVNPHSKDSPLANIVVTKIDEARENVAKLISGKKEGVIFTSGTTSSLNMISIMLKSKLKKGDEILLSIMNHNSNICPWMTLADEIGAEVILTDDLLSKINSKTKIIAFSEINNTYQTLEDYDSIIKKAKENNIIIINDAAQSVMHNDVKADKYDVVCFSGNKVYGPTGIGVLYISPELLLKLIPSCSGGGSIVDLTTSGFNYIDTIKRFEPGTQNTAGILGLNAAIKYFLDNKDFEDEGEVSKYAYEELNKIDKVKIHSSKANVNIMFSINDSNSQDVVSYLGSKKIILRSGKHCAHLACSKKEEHSTVRLTLGMYNNKDDIDKLISVINNTEYFIEV